jgi:hypothetical protein
MEMADTAILGLRLNDGLDVGEFPRRFGLGLMRAYGPVMSEMSIGPLSSAKMTGAA